MNHPFSALPPFPVPVVTTGPGSQPESGDWSYLPLPSTIDTWRAPDTPEPGTPGTREVLTLLRGMVAALDGDPFPAHPHVFPVHALSADAHRLLAQVMGEGEVSAQVALTNAWAEKTRTDDTRAAWAGKTRAEDAQTRDAWTGKTQADDTQTGEALAEKTQAGDTQTGEALAGKTRANDMQAGAALAEKAQAWAGDAQARAAQIRETSADEAHTEETLADKMQPNTTQTGETSAHAARTEETRADKTQANATQTGKTPARATQAEKAQMNAQTRDALTHETLTHAPQAGKTPDDKTPASHEPQAAPLALARIQESRYPGIWRVIVDSISGERLGDWLEAGALPAVILDQAQRNGAVRGIIPDVRERHKRAADHEDKGHEASENAADPAAGLMNAPAIASEIAAAQTTAIGQRGAGSHVINFSLLPVTPADIAWLEAMLGTGTIALFSTGYGKCTVTATGWRYVWRVRYFDGSNRVLLDTLDITRVPEVVVASSDDLADSLSHLREIVEWLEQD